MSNLFVAGINIEGLSPFADAFPYEYYVILPILEKEGLAVLKALRILDIRPTWERSVKNGHSLYIADKDFTPEGVRKIIQALLVFAEGRGIPVEQPEEVSVPVQTASAPQLSPAMQRRVPEERKRTSSTLLTILRNILPVDIANSIAREISDRARRQLNGETHQFKAKREALATMVVEKFSQGRGFRAVATNPLATKFHIIDGAGNYAGYSMNITPLPPFEVEVFKIWQIDGRWVNKQVFCQSFNPQS